jgi:hypothetical protein
LGSSALYLFICVLLAFSESRCWEDWYVMSTSHILKFSTIFSLEKLLPVRDPSSVYLDLKTGKQPLVLSEQLLLCKFTKIYSRRYTEKTNSVENTQNILPRIPWINFSTCGELVTILWTHVHMYTQYVLNPIFFVSTCW